MNRAISWWRPRSRYREEHSMDQCRSRLELSENFERHWSIPILGEIRMDLSLVHTFSWGNSYGPMALKVLQKFHPTLALVHGWLFPALTSVSKRVPGIYGKRGLERGWQKRLAKGWRRVGTGLAKGWRRVGGFPCTLQFRNSRGARLETLVCDSMVLTLYE